MPYRPPEEPQAAAAAVATAVEMEEAAVAAEEGTEIAIATTGAIGTTTAAGVRAGGAGHAPALVPAPETARTTTIRRNASESGPAKGAGHIARTARPAGSHSSASRYHRSRVGSS